MPTIRLDKLLANAGIGSRREVSAIIRAGRVTVDGVIVTDTGAHVAGDVAVDGTPVEARKHHHRLLNKPRGYVTSTVDHDGPAVTSLVEERAWMPVGRLDMDTEGLLLLTTDGDLAHRLTHPKYKVDKTYAASLARPAKKADVTAFAEGLPWGDEDTLLPATLAWGDDPTQVTVVLREGRFHQVKRMFVARENEVLALTRVRFGPLALGELAVGEARLLTRDEERSLYEAVKMRYPLA